MKISFAKNTVRVNNKYMCECGHKFTRMLSDWFTMSPLNNKTSAECREECLRKLIVMPKLCPKCDKLVKPIANQPTTGANANQAK